MITIHPRSSVRSEEGHSATQNRISRVGESSNSAGRRSESDAFPLSHNEEAIQPKNSQLEAFDFAHKAVLEFYQLRDVFLMVQSREYVRLQGAARSVAPISTSGLNLSQIAVQRGKDFARAADVFKDGISVAKKVLQERKRFISGCAELSGRWRLSVSTAAANLQGGAPARLPTRTVHVDCSYAAEGSLLKSPQWSVDLFPGLGTGPEPMRWRCEEVQPRMTVRLALAHVDGTILASETMWDNASLVPPQLLMSPALRPSCILTDKFNPEESSGLTELEKNLSFKRHDCLSRDIFASMQRSLERMQEANWFVKPLGDIRLHDNRRANAAVSELMNATLHTQFRLLQSSVNRISVSLSDSVYLMISLTENESAKEHVSAGKDGLVATADGSSDAKIKKYVLRSKNHMKNKGAELDRKAEGHSAMDITTNEALSADALYLHILLRYGIVSLQRSARNRWLTNRRINEANDGKVLGAVKVFQKPTDGGPLLDPCEGVLLAFVNHFKLRLVRYCVQSAVDELKQSLSVTNSNLPLTSHWLMSGDELLGSEADLVLRTTNAFLSVHIDGANIAVTCYHKTGADEGWPSGSGHRRILDSVDVKTLKSVIASLLKN